MSHSRRRGFEWGGGHGRPGLGCPIITGGGPTGEKTKPLPTVTHPARPSGHRWRTVGPGRTAGRRCRSSGWRPAGGPRPRPIPSAVAEPAYQAPPWSTNPATPSPSWPRKSSHDRDPVLGGAEVGPVAGEGVAPERPGPDAQPEIEFRARHRILEPAALEVQDPHLVRAGLEHRRGRDLHRAAVEPRRVVQAVQPAPRGSRTRPAPARRPGPRGCGPTPSRS